MEMLRTRELCRLLKVSRSALHSWKKTCPDFPKPVRMGPRLVGYLKKDVEDWLEKQKEKAA